MKDNSSTLSPLNKNLSYGIKSRSCITKHSLFKNSSLKVLKINGEFIKYFL